MHRIASDIHPHSTKYACSRYTGRLSVLADLPLERLKGRCVILFDALTQPDQHRKRTPSIRVVLGRCLLVPLPRDCVVDGDKEAPVVHVPVRGCTAGVTSGHIHVYGRQGWSGKTGWLLLLLAKADNTEDDTTHPRLNMAGAFPC